MISNRTLIFGLLSIFAVIFITGQDPSSGEIDSSPSAKIHLSSLANSLPASIGDPVFGKLKNARRSDNSAPTMATAIAAVEIQSPLARHDTSTLKSETLKSGQTNSRPEDDPTVEAKEASVFLLDENRGLYTLNAEFRHPLASLTKLMTTVIAQENMDPSQPVTIGLDDVLTEGDAGNFNPGEIFSVKDLVVAALIPSSNDAAESLARFYGRERFLQAMQDKAGELEMTNSTFADASGLSLLDQSSITDWQKLLGYIWRRHPDILAITREPSRQIVELKSRLPRTLRNTNQFAGQADFMGGKTGYTPDAQGNLVSIFNYRGQLILITILGAEDRFAETQKLYTWAKKVLLLQ